MLYFNLRFNFIFVSESTNTEYEIFPYIEEGQPVKMSPMAPNDLDLEGLGTLIGDTS